MAVADVSITTSIAGTQAIQDNLKGIEESLKRLSSANDNLRKSTDSLSDASKNLTKAANDNAGAIRGVAKEASLLDKIITKISSGFRAFTDHLERNQKKVLLHISVIGKLGVAHNKLSDGLDKTGRQFGSLLARTQDLISRGLLKLSSVLESLASMFNSIRNSLLKFGGILTVAITVPIGLAVQSLINLGAQAQRSDILFRAKLGSMAVEASAFVEMLVNDFGQARTEIQNSVAAFNNFALAVEIGEKASLAMSKALTVLTLDLSAMFGPSPGEIFSDFLSTLVGNVIPGLKAMGIVVTAQTVKNKGLELGLKGLSTQWSLQQKVMLRAILILEGAKRSVGGFARSMDNPIIQARIFTNQLQNLRQEIGLKLLPIFNILTATIIAIIPDFRELGQKFLDLDDATRGWIITIGVTIVALGPLMLIFGGLFKLIGLVTAAVALLSGALGTLLGIASIDDIPLIGALKNMLVLLIKLAFAWAVLQTASEAFFVNAIPSFDNLKRAALSFQLILARIKAGFTISPEVKLLEAEIARLDQVIKDAEADFSFGTTLLENWEENLRGMKNAIEPFALDAFQILEDFGKAAVDKTAGLIGDALNLDPGQSNIPGILDDLKRRLGELVGLDLSDLSFDKITEKFQEFITNAGADVKQDLGKAFSDIISESLTTIKEALQGIKTPIDLKKLERAIADFETLRASIRGIATETNVLAQAEEFRRRTMVKLNKLRKEGFIDTEKLKQAEIELGEAIERIARKPVADLIKGLNLSNQAIQNSIDIIKVKIKGDAVEIKAIEKKIRLKTIENALRRQGVANIEEEIKAIEKLINKEAELTEELKEQTKIKAAADTMVATMKNAVDSIQNLISDTFEDALNGSINSWEDFADRVVQIMTKLAADIAVLMIIKPLLGDIFGDLTPGGTAGGGGGFIGDIASFFDNLFGGVFGGESGGVGRATTAGTSLPGGIGGFQHGGSFKVGGKTGVDSNLVQFLATRGEVVTVEPNGTGLAEEAKPTTVERPIQINFNINTPDADSFRNSQSQIMTKAATVLARAQSRR